jgi:hypothetical protein
MVVKSQWHGLSLARFSTSRPGEPSSLITSPYDSCFSLVLVLSLDFFRLPTLQKLQIDNKIDEHLGCMCVCLSCCDRWQQIETGLNRPSTNPRFCVVRWILPVDDPVCLPLGVYAYSYPFIPSITSYSVCSTFMYYIQTTENTRNVGCP